MGYATWCCIFLDGIIELTLKRGAEMIYGDLVLMGFILFDSTALTLAPTATH